MGVAAVFPTGTRFEEIVEYFSGEGALPRPNAPAAQPSAKSAARPVVLESGIEVKPVYGPEDLAGIDPANDIGRPGEFPFTRGIHREMYRKRPWTMRQYAGFGTPGETNARFRFLIEHGQDALNVAFDLPTQLGLDSDDPRAEGEVGRVGMAVDTLADMEVAFEGVPLDRVSVSLTVNAVTPVLLAMYVVVAERQGVPRSAVRGTTQNDILKEYVGRGAWIFPVEPSLRLVADTIEFCAREVPHYYPVSVCGYHIRESGATPVQEMAYALSIARAYVGLGVERGLAIDEFAHRISFNFDVFGNLWEQVAKFRAGRRLWARMLAGMGAKEAATMQLKMIAGGGGGGLTIEEPENNIVRGTTYALASALGGAQTMALCCYDEAYTIPSEKASLLSLRTMQILAEETGLCDTVDPLAGSYYVEWLTSEMERRIAAEIARVESEWGGIVNAIARGYLQREVARQAYRYERGIQSGEIAKVGVNRHPTAAGALSEEVLLHKCRPEAAEEQRRRLAEVRARRDGGTVARAIDRVRADAISGANLMPAMLEAVQAYATLGEITRTLEEVFGRWREPVGV
ncbi:MAG: methylmalonyl-CoA mutase [Planctomycetes bacterium]|nr:methylmalonyl-CoA mutase [Planctomycetota bacterium]